MIYKHYRDSNSRNKNSKKEENDDRKEEGNIIDLCDWIGSWSDLETHLNECKCQIIKCQNKGCLESIIRGDQAEHDKICDWYQIECPMHCGMFAIFSMYVYHIHIYFTYHRIENSEKSYRQTSE